MKCEAKHIRRELTIEERTSVRETLALTEKEQVAIRHRARELKQELLESHA